MMRFFVLLLLPGSLCTLSGATRDVGPGYPWGNLQAAAAGASAGDTILFHGGTYAGGQYVAGLAGDPAAWITILAAPGEQVKISGGPTAWQLSDPAYVVIEGFIFEHQTLNGVNIDDGGDYSTPAHHVHVRQCTFREITATGNNDLLKLSGLDDFEISRCTFADGAAGGSGIDMVGCHRGKIAESSFERMGSNAIQAKGGTSALTIERNFFLHCGARTLNLGGSTGLEYFRPIDAPYEASDLLVWANVIIGSDAAVAYVGAVNVHVINNTIIRPQVWVTRILQETVDSSRFLECGDNSFRQNLVLQGTIRTETNVGPNTRPGSFIYRDNFWHNEQTPSWSGPSLPVPDPGLVLGPDPHFVDTLAHNYRLQRTSPAIGLIASMEPPLEDFDGRAYAMPRSAGAFEGNTQSTEVQPPVGLPPNIPRLRGYPNPFNASIVIELSMPAPGHVRLEVYALDGTLVARLLDGELNEGTHTTPFQSLKLATGVYLVRARTSGTILTERVVLIR
jgi:hypothetical protein